MRYFRSLAKISAMSALLIGCMEDPGASETAAKPVQTTRGGASSQVYKAHKVAEAVAGFRAICLDPAPTVNRVESETLNRGFGLRGLSFQERQGTPMVEYNGFDAKGRRIYSSSRHDPNEVFSDFSCAIGFRGQWANTIADDVQRHMAAAGYRAVSPLRQKTDTLPSGQTAFGLGGVYQKNGKRAALLITQADSARKQTGNVRTFYTSGTLLILTTKR